MGGTVTGATVHRKSSTPGASKPGVPRYTHAPSFDEARRGRVITRGHEGANVGELQERLGLTPTGKFDAMTEDAVRQFQDRHNLDPDGKVGPRTLKALDAQQRSRETRTDKKEPKEASAKRKTAKKAIGTTGPTGAPPAEPRRTSTGARGQLGALVNKPVAARADQKPEPKGADPAEVKAQVTKHLSRSLTDWAVTDKDVDKVHSALGGLNKADYKKQLDGMAKNGQLDRYIGNMGTSERQRFLGQATAKGYVKQEPGDQPLQSRFNPPKAPDMYVNDPKLPGEMRDVIHKVNKEQASAYGDKYNAYIDRYRAAVKKAPNAAAIRRLGPPEEPKSMIQPGMTVSHPDHDKKSSDWHNSTPNLSTYHANQAIGDRMYDFTGERKPGSVWLKAEAKVGIKLEAKGPRVNVGGSVDLDNSGKVRRASKIEMEQKVGPVSVKVEPGKKTSDSKVAVGVGIGGFGTKIDNKGGAETSLGVGKKGAAKLGVYAAGHSVQKTFEGGIKAELGGDESPLKGEVKIGVGMKTITAEEVKDAFDTIGFHPTDKVKALFRQGMTWNKVPPAFRKRAQKVGWTEAEWNKWVQAYQK